MLRIAVLTRYFPSSGEPWQGRSAYQTVRMLARQAEVDVFYPHPAYPAWLTPRTRLYRSLDTSFSPPDVHVGYYNFPALPLVSRPVNGLLAARSLLGPIRAFKPDLIFSIFLYPESYAALRVGKELGVPVVAMGIGSDIHSIHDPISAWYTRQVLRDADFLVTVSEDLRQKAIGMGASPQRSRAVINGCDLSTFRPMDRAEARRALNLAPDAPTVVYIGRMDLRKGLRELVEAAAAVRTRRPDVEVYLVGEGADRPQVRSAIEAHNASGFVHDLPACAPDTVSTWMAAADVVTLPSYMEGCPNVVLEALACGRPVVATTVGGIPEIMSNSCGRLIPPRDSTTLAEALAEVLASPWDAAEISSHWGRSWNTVAKELMTIFESVMSRKAAMHVR